ncbi:LCP family protein [Propionicicella superfundia]|uniref:LCP family protein n=1 Tax=Propionicicella superfundia TaxID=348582 RepID=UPI001B7F9A4F|nr:LCP family protein [Propionicicella superfundia]
MAVNLPPTSRRRHRRPVRWWVWAVAGLVIAAAVTAIAFPLCLTQRLQRLSVPDTNPNAGTTWLVIGSDSRERTPQGVGQAEFDPRGDIRGARADVVLLIRRSEGGQTYTVSVPRDLVVTASGVPVRLTSTLSNGPAVTVRALCETLQVGVDHVVIVDGAAFVNVVNALGGVGVSLERPVRDVDLGLDLPAGAQLLDGADALRLVRTRHPEQLVGGRWTSGDDAAGAAWRAQWSAMVFTAVQEQVKAADPVTLARVAWTVSGDITVDDRAGLTDLMALARSVAAPTTLPVTRVNALAAAADEDTVRSLARADLNTGCRA